MYRLITEDKNPRAIEAILDVHFDSYTIYRGNRYWKGQREFCLIVEIVDSSFTWKAIQLVADQIRVANEQDSVLVQVIHEQSKRIGP